MSKKILILGASGNFGSKIAKELANSNIPIILTGRNKQALLALKNNIYQFNPKARTEIITFDVNKEFLHQLTTLKPFLVINTCGPFQLTDYSIALSCISLRIHYIDLADGRDFVNGVHEALNDAA